MAIAAEATPANANHGRDRTNDPTQQHNTV
jgi:hypothetical protein